MENIILAATNFSALFAIVAYATRGDYFRAVAVAAAALASFAYHLVECHKHAMPGIGVYTGKRDHLVFINIDRFFAAAAVLVCGWPIRLRLIQPRVWFYAINALVGITISESLSDYFNPPKRQWIHVVSHSMWHIAMFSIAYEFALV